MKQFRLYDKLSDSLFETYYESDIHTFENGNFERDFWNRQTFWEYLRDVTDYNLREALLDIELYVKEIIKNVNITVEILHERKS